MRAEPRVPTHEGVIRGWPLAMAGRTAGLITIALLQIYWYLQPGPPALKALTAAFTAVCLASRAGGLLVFAGIAPIVSMVAALMGGPEPGMSALLMEQLVLAIGMAELIRPDQSGQATRIGAPALVIAIVALASAIAMVPAAAAATAPPGMENDQSTFLRLLLDRRSAHFSSVWAPVFAAITVAECALLGWIAERTVRRTPRLAARLVATSLIAHAAASVISIERVVRMAVVLGGGLASLPRMLMTARFSPQSEVHAQASALLLAGLAGFGLFSDRRMRNAGVVALLLAIGAGLWITGSRAAIVLAAVATIAAILLSARRKSRQRYLVAAAAAAAVAVGAWLAVYPSTRYSTTATSVNSRLVMTKVGLELFERAPVFGIGIAQFYRTSAEVAGPEIARFSPGSRENAHNNFLQVLAEQGIVGLAAMVWWLGVVLLVGWRAQIAHSDSLRAALILAIGACVGTWLVGHPLLTPEFAFVFWLYAGILLGTAESSVSKPRRLVWVVVVAILASVPARAFVLRNAAELDHLGFGLSLWEFDDAQRYRQAGANFAIYLPAQDKPVTVPIRRAPGVIEPLRLEVRIRGRVVQTLTIADDEWKHPLIVVPHEWKRFELIEFAVREPSPAPGTPEVLFRVGRAEIR